MNRSYGYNKEELNVKLVNQAIAKEKIATAVNSGNFITKYKLKAASSVNVALKTLINKELVYKAAEGYTIYDRFMAIWLRRQP